MMKAKITVQHEAIIAKSPLEGREDALVILGLWNRETHNLLTFTVIDGQVRGDDCLWVNQIEKTSTLHTHTLHNAEAVVANIVQGEGGDLTKTKWSNRSYNKIGSIYDLLD